MKAQTRNPRFACSLLLACALPLAATAQPSGDGPGRADPLLSIVTAQGDRQLADLSARLLPEPAGAATRSAAGFDAWTALGKGASLTMGPRRQRAVDDSLRHYREHSYALAHNVRQAALYLPYVTRRLVESDLPPELALLPFVESAYDPLALSPSGAAGLWQITAATADRLGLKRNQWYDGRNDIVRSTDAAITYLHYLNRRFGGDWLLTLAAYNGGEGRVTRAVMANLASGRETDFWALDLPPETRAYVPRFLALARLFRDADALRQLRPQTLDQPRSLETLILPGQISLARAAQLADIDYELLKQLNAGFKRDVTPPQGPHRLLLPHWAARRFVAAVTFARESWDPASLQPVAPPAQTL